MRLARAQRRLSQAQLASVSGLKQPDISKIEKGLTQSTPAIDRLARALCVPTQWLELGLGPDPIWAAWPAEPDVKFSLNVEEGPASRGRVPLISWVQAGDWNGGDYPPVSDDADRWIECPASHSASTYALRVRGDSMTAPHGNARTYPEGCIIFVDPLRRLPVNGERIIAKLNGSDEVTFKVFKQEDGRMWLQPINPMHQPIRDEFKVLGTIIGKWEDE